MRLVATVSIIIGLDQWFFTGHVFKEGPVSKNKC